MEQMEHYMAIIIITPTQSIGTTDNITISLNSKTELNYFSQTEATATVIRFFLEFL